MSQLRQLLIEQANNSLLPNGYTLCEYLESGRGQFIDTGYIANNNTYFSVGLTVINTYNGNSLFGARQANNVKTFSCFAGGNSLAFGYNNVDTGWAVNNVITGIEHSIVISCNGIYVDDVLRINVGSEEWSCDRNIYLFRVNENGNTPNRSCRISSLYISELSVDKLNLVPCLDTDGVPCMYDTVSNSALYNAGSGTFGYKTTDGLVVSPVNE